MHLCRLPPPPQHARTGKLYSRVDGKKVEQNSEVFLIALGTNLKAYYDSLLDSSTLTLAIAAQTKHNRPTNNIAGWDLSKLPRLHENKNILPAPYQVHLWYNHLLGMFSLFSKALSPNLSPENGRFVNHWIYALLQKHGNTVQEVYPRESYGFRVTPELEKAVYAKIAQLEPELLNVEGVDRLTGSIKQALVPLIDKVIEATRPLAQQMESSHESHLTLEPHYLHATLVSPRSSRYASTTDTGGHLCNLTPEVFQDWSRTLNPKE